MSHAGGFVSNSIFSLHAPNVLTVSRVVPREEGSLCASTLNVFKTPSREECPRRMSSGVLATSGVERQVSGDPGPRSEPLSASAKDYEASSEASREG